MRAKFRGKTLNINNLSAKSNEFYTEWNYYTIEIFKTNKNDYYCHKEYYKENKFYVMVTTPWGGLIVDGSTAPTQSKCLQIAFDNIDCDIIDKECMVANKAAMIDEYGKEIENDIDEIEYWLNQMKY